MSHITYTIQVSTASLRGAGTDANVHITLEGASGKKSKRILLDNYEDNFERGKMDIFSVDSVDLGDIRWIYLEHDNSGNGPGWFVEYVLITNEKTRQRWFAPIYRWLARDEADGCTSILKHCTSMPVDYQVLVQTGTPSGAGTDANVYLMIEGEHGWSEEVMLDSYRNDFENGQLDSFTITMPSEMGDLSRIRVRHDNTGGGPGWFLDNIKIRNLENNREWLFNCNNWLAADEGDGRIMRVLEAE